MIQNKLYAIPFKGLTPGVHRFDFEVSTSLFQEVETSEIVEADIKAEVDLDRKSSFMEVHFHLIGYAKVACDRCLDLVSLPVEYTDTLYVKFGEETGEQDDNLLVLAESEDYLDLSQYLYEFAHLSLPLRKVHPLDETGKSTCNSEMLKKLSQYLIQDEIEE